MDRRTFLKGAVAAIAVPATFTVAKAKEPPNRWYAHPVWSHQDQREYFELRDEPDRPLTAYEKIDRLVTRQEVGELLYKGRIIRFTQLAPDNFIRPS